MIWRWKRQNDRAWRFCVLLPRKSASPFQLTGDPRWYTGGDFYAAYDLQLGDDGVDDDQALAVTDNIISESVEESGIESDGTVVAVKAFSGKTDAEIKKMMKSFRENQVSDGHDDEDGSQLYFGFQRNFINGRQQCNKLTK